jgi:hypothetical protein
MPRQISDREAGIAEAFSMAVKFTRLMFVVCFDPSAQVRLGDLSYGRPLAGRKPLLKLRYVGATPKRKAERTIRGVKYHAPPRNVRV